MVVKVQSLDDILVFVHTVATAEHLKSSFRAAEKYLVKKNVWS